MKLLRLCVFIFILIGCVRTNTQTPDLSGYSVPTLEIKQPVTISNGMQESW